MARILWHGIGPWHKTAYGLQTGLFAPRLRDLGHDVAIAVMGHPAGHRNDEGKPDSVWDHPGAAETRRTGLWDGMPVIGPGLTEFGLPLRSVVRDAFGGHDPDLTIVLKDAWVLDRKAYRHGPAAVWCNIDCEPMGAHDARFFRESGVTPLATSKFGLSMMRKAGLKDARYVPHGIDLAFWTPGSQDDARDLIGLPKRVFIAGIDAANIGPRKAWGEQLTAFAEFRKREARDALLLIHAAPEHPEGISLRDLAAHLDITDAVKFGAHSNMTDDQMLTWYRSLDVLLAATYGEGFGVPIVQALACGVPVIGTESSAMTEKIPSTAGWLVRGQRWWNPHHAAWWTIPRTREIGAKLGQPPKNPALVRAAAEPYDCDLITRQYWKPLIEELAS